MQNTNHSFQLYIRSPPPYTVGYCMNANTKDMRQTLILLGMPELTASSITPNEAKAILNMVSYGLDYRRDGTTFQTLVKIFATTSSARYQVSGAQQGSQVSLEGHVKTYMDNLLVLLESIADERARVAREDEERQRPVRATRSTRGSPAVREVEKKPVSSPISAVRKILQPKKSGDQEMTSPTFGRRHRTLTIVPKASGSAKSDASGPAHVLSGLLSSPRTPTTPSAARPEDALATIQNAMDLFRGKQISRSDSNKRRRRSASAEDEEGDAI
ncbi:hypothetical protein PFICI_06488 [Pestalotiopsis fici W106-1]|uniref:Uncharacterized protein n=1 Tax=Pestalotiopsis fici (strain W106-1 / CGMCC3.15140) TaxID=1229662 RepID=W3X8H0_PESFW|nr:uncharacterized protein PFICI_06488 [Pestalotiopsis fici W106-1]ETS81486.1 hypothetical protein PFICI_06488 [Pestalotiopsis fici W106-1]